MVLQHCDLLVIWVDLFQVCSKYLPLSLCPGHALLLVTGSASGASGNSILKISAWKWCTYHICPWSTGQSKLHEVKINGIGKLYLLPIPVNAIYCKDKKETLSIISIIERERRFDNKLSTSITTYFMKQSQGSFSVEA